MSFHAADDRLLQDLGRLQPLSPDPARAERVRAKCRAHLGRRRPSERAATDLDGRLVTSVLVGCFCVVYVVDLIRMALRVYGVFE
jgi:hypothetical protein